MPVRHRTTQPVAHQQGWQDYLSGFDSCPFERGSQEQTWWEEGWSQSEAWDHAQVMAVIDQSNGSGCSFATPATAPAPAPAPSNPPAVGMA